MKFKLPIIAAILILTSCHKEEIDPLTTETTIIDHPIVDREIEGSIIGNVYNENNEAVADAIVQIYSGSTKTNKYGVFTFNKVKLDPNGTYITVDKNGYLLGSDMVFPGKARTYSSIKLMALESGKIFDANKGGNIKITGGGNIEFPPNAISHKDGTLFNGNVNVTAKLLNPNDKDLAALMPGGMIGDSKSGATVVLGTAGMIGVSLRSDSGEALNLFKDKKATISIPALAASRPATIPLWSFMESKGRWKEEGIAILIDGNYVAEVSHFSFWNCDAPFPLINVCGKVVYEDGTIAKNVWVTVYADGLSSSSGVTDENGEFCGKMPKGVKLTFSVSSGANCADPFFTKEIAALFDDTVLNPFVVPILGGKKLIVKGSLLCNGNPISNGIVVVEAQNYRKIFKANELGKFEENLTFLLCNNIKDYKIFGFDELSNEASEIQVVSIDNAQDLVVDVCKGCDIKGKFVLNCDDRMKIEIENGSGNYTYLWSNGKSSQEIIALNSSTIGETYCVTVTDITKNCSKAFCQIFKGKLRVDFSGLCSYQLESVIYGGSPPYTYKWFDGTTQPVCPVGNLGLYCVTITDAVGCTAEGCIQTVTPLVINPVPIYCDSNIFALETGQFISGKIYVPGTNSSIEITDTDSLDVFRTTYQFQIFLQNGVCETEYQIQLPHLKSFEAVVTNTSCPSCSDGFIDFSLGTECVLCNIGSVKIFSLENLTVDLSVQNAAKMLSKGLYYAVVTDKNTGCYIAHQKIEIK